MVKTVPATVSSETARLVVDQITYICSEANDNFLHDEYFGFKERPNLSFLLEILETLMDAEVIE